VSAARDRRTIPELDGLRGVAVSLVMLFHFTRGWGGHDVLCRFVAWSAWVGVDPFFVISGFLITRMLLQTSTGARYYRNFYARRLLRIVPLYYGHGWERRFLQLKDRFQNAAPNGASPHTVELARTRWRVPAAAAARRWGATGSSEPRAPGGPSPR